MKRKTNCAPAPYQKLSTKSVVKAIKAKDEGGLLRLDKNESAFGPAPGVNKAICEAAGTINYYAPMNYATMRTAIAERFEIDPDRITCTSGSEQALDIITRVYAREGDEVLYPEYSYIDFQIVAFRVGATAIPVPNKNQFELDVDAVLGAITERTKIIFIANPNNPTGYLNPNEDIERLIAEVPSHIVIVLDCAYAEYCEEPFDNMALRYTDSHVNVVVTRTLSKAYGMAGLRAGWAYACKDITRALGNLQGICGVNILAQKASVAAMAATEFTQSVRQETAKSRNFLTNWLDTAGLPYIPSSTNFVTFEIPRCESMSAQGAVEYLAQHGVLTRSNEDYGLDDWVRITLGRVSDMETVCKLLSNYLRKDATGGG